MRINSMNQTPKLDTDFVTIYENKIDSNYLISLIEMVNEESYKFNIVDRRPHLTMELPVVHNEKDNYAAIEVRSTFNNILHESLIDFLKRKNIKRVKQSMLNNNYISVSKMIVGTPAMQVHTDLPEESPLTDSFIAMLYVNDNFNNGELYFPDNDFIYKPQAGDMVYYKRSVSHGVNVVTGGDRYTIGCGFLGPIV
jgi:hypothetical protein